MTEGMLNKQIWNCLLLLLGVGAILWFPPAAWAQQGVEEVKTGTVVVTGTKTEHEAADAPVKTAVVTREEIAAKHCRTIQDALDTVPGLKLGRDSGSWGDKGKVAVRGLAAKHVLVLVDGHRIYGGHQDAVDINSYPVQMVERIEIVKGPGASLYGSEAMGGVINIITRNPEEKPVLGASVEMGSRNTQRLSADAGIKHYGFGAYLNYSYHHSDGIEPSTDEYTENQVQGTFSYDISERSPLRLKLLYGEQSMDYEDRKQTRLGFNPSWEWRPDDVSVLKAWASWFSYEHTTEDKSTDYTHDVFETEINYSRLIGSRNNLTVGGQLEKEERKDRGKTYDADEETKSFFISDEIDLHPVVLVAGIRLDSHDLWGDEYNPKLNALVHVTDKFKLRAGVGRAFRGPSLSELYGNWRMGPYQVQANPDLKPETSVGYELGLDFIPSSRMSMGLTLFRNEVENLISSRIVKTGRPPWNLYWENVDEAVTQGVELDFRMELLTNWTVAVGCAYWDTEDKKTGLELAQKPRYKANLETCYRLPDLGMALILSGEYIGSRYYDEENTEELDPYTVWDILLSKDFGKHVQAFVKLENIFGQDDVQDEYDLDGAGIMAGVTTSF